MPENHAAPSEITTSTVEHLAGLARIALTDTEIETLTSELGSILTNIAKVSEVATPDVPATSHPIPLSNVTREDVVSDVLSREEALQNAPAAADGMFRVSSILGEEQ
ncbi:Asp-tRNA(Asn)/Glu-tRNA(Gln) amidotransferase subunit GatC [Leucobacter denitrificans]|uniref:Aspartyl/glutamyl-tRNA(Asn/Gln) amidotransferase subunit C n=1 Tax=Leucobacter denitrificans TaxID=683042 RepID=A0A7G9S501_9MICO|nr:Asp-tRNA(Asn)/Glu-tRNA(Gln) amidotransferase subunit GatC [Leucobacter denitrificans]QNN62926.1 Asp-tRNA(Asn)/Glu-tRNA(Gln) amidotransferase subunit GatC [Leucobacter denitrificans]